jgi:FixJ family two-component response regulator/anti-sigma regulatory factor (Ser/Thr protein kinase)
MACSSRVLVVEDDQASRAFLEIALTKQGYEVVAAEDAAGAQAQLTPASIGTFSCVVTDYLMPGHNGLELLAWIRQHDPSLATILVTAVGEKNLVAESLRGGAIDFLDKPIDLATLLLSVTRAVERTGKSRHLNESESAMKELGRAQQRMLGMDALQGLGQVDICSYPKQEAGGDFFSRFGPDPNRQFFLLTDVSGHDPQAAYISAYFQGLVRGLLGRGDSVPGTFDVFNRFLLEEWSQAGASGRLQEDIGTSVAACALLLDVAAQKATVYTQGAPAPVYCHPDGEARVVGKTGGAPLGWFPQPGSESATCSVSGGGSFYLWTDGLEALAEQHGVSALSLAHALQEAAVKKNRPAWVEAATDDILLAVVHLARNQSQDGTFQPLLAETYHGAQSAEIDRFQSLWQRSLNLAVPELSEVKLHDVLLASREALLNALEHGCGGQAAQSATFQASYCPQQRTIRVRVSDSGSGHDGHAEEQERLADGELADGHRGLILVKHLANSVIFERQGASVVMNFTWP